MRRGRDGSLFAERKRASSVWARGFGRHIAKGSVSERVPVNGKASRKWSTSNRKLGFVNLSTVDFKLMNELRFSRRDLGAAGRETRNSHAGPSDRGR